MAVANTPGLAGSLLVGLTAAKTLCLACDLPLVAVNHLQAHIYACRLAAGRDVFPCVGLIVSGGHSNLYRCETPLDFTPLGGTIDDAAGEAFDKVASLLGLRLSRRAGIAAGRGARRPARRFRLPRPLLDDATRLDFSFSGLKTAVRYQLFGVGRPEMDAAALDPQTGRRHGGQLSGGGHRLPGRQGGAGAGADRASTACASAAAWRPIGRSASGWSDSPRSTASNFTFRRCRSAPTTR